MIEQRRDDYIRQFYQGVAENYGQSALSTMQDPFIRQMEMQFVLDEIEDFITTHGCYPRVLDLGCGNGILLATLRAHFPHLSLSGLEFTPELLELAKKRELPNVAFSLGDMRSLKTYPTGPFDIIITERSLINLGSWDEQMQALENMTKVLAFPGRLLLIESFEESLQQLNRAKKELGLPAQKQSPQNNYLREKFTNFLKQRSFFERTTKLGRHGLSKHFYLTRVFHPVIRPSGTRSKFSKLVEFFEQAMEGQPREGFSPIQLRSFDRRLK
jgi:ubiquinone/menaquinone biosynthesis C-methylase UbiE